MTLCPPAESTNTPKSMLFHYWGTQAHLSGWANSWHLTSANMKATWLWLQINGFLSIHSSVQISRSLNLCTASHKMSLSGCLCPAFSLQLWSWLFYWSLTIKGRWGYLEMMPKVEDVLFLRHSNTATLWTERADRHKEALKEHRLNALKMSKREATFCLACVALTTQMHRESQPLSQSMKLCDGISYN